MAERVHPTPPPPPPAPPPLPPPHRCYIVDVPKDQILRVPTKETESKYKEYTRRSRRKRRPSRRRQYLCWAGGAAVLLSLLLAAAAGVLFLVYRPKLPVYSILSLTAAQPNPDRSPAMVVTLRAENPNGKIAVEYGGGGAAVSFGGATLCRGALPPLYQAPRHVDVFQVGLSAPGVLLPAELAAARRRREVALRFSATVPARFKVGAVWSWTVAVKLRCAVAVDSLTESSNVLSSSCRAHL
ncbi:NDR1/HIN1-like protein 13 [Wolffia australiana]